MKLARTRSNVFTLTATSQELSALMAAARMTLEIMQGDPDAPPEALHLLARVLREYDSSLARLETQDGRRARPSRDSPGDAN